MKLEIICSKISPFSISINFNTHTYTFVLSRFPSPSRSFTLVLLPSIGFTSLHLLFDWLSLLLLIPRAHSPHFHGITLSLYICTCVSNFSLSLSLPSLWSLLLVRCVSRVLHTLLETIFNIFMLSHKSAVISALCLYIHTYRWIQISIKVLFHLAIVNSFAIIFPNDVVCVCESFFWVCVCVCVYIYLCTCINAYDERRDAWCSRWCVQSSSTV